MNWKSTAAVSSVTLLATWLGWTPARQSSDAPPVARDMRPVETSDIQDQAARLQTRVRSELDYQDPKRNPFRFISQRLARQPRSIDVVAPPPPVALPEAFPFTLSGMATDDVDGQPQRTAIVTSASEVLFAKTGEQVGSYTVTRIDESGVELTAVDGTVRWLALTP
jgi:hypothetical protein